MAATPSSHLTADVPTQIFAAFLEAVAGAGLPVAKVAALRKALLERRDFSERAIREALAAEESVP